MVNIQITEKKQPYNWVTGIKKTLKNALIFLGPSLLAWLSGYEGTEYAMIASVALYYLKNFLENRKN